jgi:anti-sigma B factor antagonist
MVAMTPTASASAPVGPADEPPAAEPGLCLAGELDFLAVPGVWSTLQPYLGGDGDVVVDITGVSFIDAAGCRLLVRAAGILPRSRHLVLVGASTHVRRVLEICGGVRGSRLVTA